MSILAAMFVTLYNSYCSVCLNKDFFHVEQLPKKYLIACAEQQRSIILE